MRADTQIDNLMHLLNGPFDLDAYGAQEALSGAGVMPGVYVIGRRGIRGIELLYAGRSDTGLWNRLVDHMSGKGDSTELRSARPKVYWYKRFPIPAYAYEFECLLYHTNAFPLNRIHPAKPDQYSRCRNCWA